jgi:hypothetical protein
MNYRKYGKKERMERMDILPRKTQKGHGIEVLRPFIKIGAKFPSSPSLDFRHLENGSF